MKSATKLNDINESDDEYPMQSEKAMLAQNIKIASMKNARPKTRGDPSVQNLDMTPPPVQDYAQVTGLDDNNVQGGKTNSSNFNSRRKTHNDTSDTGTNRNQLTTQGQGHFAPNATQKAPNLNNAVQFNSTNKGADHLSSRSPDKNNRGMTMMQSKGMITSEGQTNMRSKTNITNFASSLREDELMISSSQVDPLEKSGAPRPPSNMKDYNDHLAI